jgi:hypothetical protein
MSLLVRTCSTERMNASRIAARVMIALGGMVWAIMFFSAASVQRYSNLTYTFTDITKAGIHSLLPLALTVGVFVLCMFYEKLAAVVLFVGAGAVVVWGILASLEPLMWASVLVALALPMVISATLLLLAASTQRVCELEGTVV